MSARLPHCCNEEALTKRLRKAVPGIRVSNKFIYPFEIDTVHGSLGIVVRDGAIRTRFDQVPAEAPQGAPLNRFSGKWNFEFLLGADDAQRAVEAIAAVAITATAADAPACPPVKVLPATERLLRHRSTAPGESLAALAQRSRSQRSQQQSQPGLFG